MKNSFLLLLLIVTLICSSCYTGSRKIQFSNCFYELLQIYANCDNDQDCESSTFFKFNSCMSYDHTFPIHFVILTNRLSGSESTIERLMQTQIDTLNRYFTVEDASIPGDNRRRIISFSYRSTTHYSDAFAIGGDLVDFAAPDFVFEDRGDFRDLFNAETNPELKDTEAINIYIVDAQATTNSSARNNNNRPYILLDYARIDGSASRVAVQEHEMGHCFVLDHVCNPAGKNASNTNIMATGGSYQDNGDCRFRGGTSSVDCPGSGGRRNIGFDNCQSTTILDAADDIYLSLGL